MLKENLYYKNFTRDYAEKHLTPSKYDQYVCPYCSSGLGGHATGAMTLFDNGFFCFSCRKSGDIFDLIGHFEGIEGYRNQLRRVKELYGPVDPEKFPNEDDENESVDEKEAPADFSKYLEEMHEYIHQTDYWKKRGLSEAIVNRFHIGFDACWVHPNRQEDETITPSPRLIIPTSPTSYLARDTRPNIKDGTKMRVGRTEIFNEAILYSSQKPIVLTEGELDAMSVMEVGGEAVALGSTSVAKQFIEKIIKRQPVQPLILAFDDDAAGRKCTEVIKKGLLEADVLFTVFPGFSGYHDMNELLCANRKELEIIVKSFEVNERAEKEVMETTEVTAADAKRDSYLKNSNASFLEDLLNEKDPPFYMPTGFPKFDLALNGGVYEGLYVIGGITAIGKTTLTMQIADKIAESGTHVLIFSLEMSRKELIAKSLSRHSVIASLDIEKTPKHGKTMREVTTFSSSSAHEEKERAIFEIAANAYRSYASNIFVFEGVGNITVKEIREKVANHIDLTGCRPLVIVDYCQILSPLDIRMTDKMNIDVSIMELKRISRDFKLPICVLSSFSRQAYRSSAALESFKESGSIEYSSDVLLALDPAEDKTGGGNPDCKKIAVSILKNRNGVAGVKVPFLYYPKYNYLREE